MSALQPELIVSHPEFAQALLSSDVMKRYERLTTPAFVREDLLLNLPAHPHCDRDGDRVCRAKQVTTEEQDARRKSDWSALDKLKL